MKISRQGIDLITRWEGCELKAYRDGGGVLTIGYGHTNAAGLPKVTPGLTITAQEAKDIFVRDIVKYEIAVGNAIKRPITQAQFDAMVSLCYNIGPGAFAGSTVVKRFNNGDTNGAAEAFKLWIKDNGKKVQGLVNRRNDEVKHFRSIVPLAGGNPAPQPVPVVPAPVVAPAPEKPATAQIPAPAAPSLWQRILALFVRGS